MTFTVTNRSNNSSFPVQDGETILDAALRDNRVFPYGCRNGMCGACKSELLRGKVDYGLFEDTALTPDEVEAGKLLLCQARPQTDIVIQAEELMIGANIRIRMLPCRVSSLEQAAKDVIIMHLALPKTREFPFLPGQYIDIVLRDGQRRSFSIANLPEETIRDGLELHVRHVPGGHFTPRVFEALRVRDILRFEGPFGTYFLQSEPQTPILMIAGGTGFSPIKGLIRQSLKECPDRSVHLFWGARDEQDLYLDALVREWTNRFPGLTYTPVLSEEHSEHWQGLRGFVHEAVSSHYDDVSGHDVYASGPPVMVDCVRETLQTRGLKLSRFFFDSFEFAPGN